MTVLFGFGMPGVMSSWGFAALHALAREAYGDYAVISTDTIDDLRQHVQNRVKRHALFVSQYPEPRLSQLVLRTNLPFLLFLENPVDAVSYLARCTEQRDTGLIRAVSASLACLEPFSDAPGALIMRRNDIGGPSGIDWLLGRIDKHFGTELSLDQMTRALQHVGLVIPGERRPLASPKLEEAAASIITGYIPPQGSGAELDETVREAAEKVLLPLEVGRFPAFPEQPVAWPESTFYSGDRPGEGIEDIVDVTGGARCLIYGPYFHLPVGRWNAKLLFNVEEDCYGQTFTIEIHSAELLGKLRICPQGTGPFEVIVPVEIADPRTGIEVRFLMDTGAIEGRLSGWSVDWFRTA